MRTEGIYTMGPRPSSEEASLIAPSIRDQLVGMYIIESLAVYG